MTTPLEIRRLRLGNDYREMLNIQGPIIQWKPVRGIAPLIEAYELMIRVRTIIGPRPDYRDEHRVLVELPEGYPIQGAPHAQMLTRPPPFHPNWFTGGRWCYGTWVVSEGLGSHVVRMIKTLQFDREITDERSAANGTARDWYVEHKNGSLFPCDRQQLPDPTHTKLFEIRSERKTFRIQGP
jgi:hypothetical protein